MSLFDIYAWFNLTKVLKYALKVRSVFWWDLQFRKCFFYDVGLIPCL
jgi:hypothetical protein